MSNYMTPMYSTMKFTDIYKNVTTFTADYAEIALGGISDATLLNKLYYLLYAKFGNSPIANYDITQFKYKLFSVIFQYGPTWESKLDIQGKLRGLLEPGHESELYTGTKAIYNHAFNPGEIAAESASSTTNQPELQYVNDQNVTNYTKSKMDAYTQLWDLLATDVTSQFLARFNNLFKKFVQPNRYLFVEDDDEQ